MSITNKFKALSIGKKIVWIPSLKRVSFCSSMEQAKKKFRGHSIEEHGIVARFWYVVFDCYI